MGSLPLIKWITQASVYHGGYVTSDDKVVPPNYLVNLLSHNDVIVDIDVKEELN